MKKPIIAISTFLFLLFFSTDIMSQDLILLKNGDKISCNIKELGETEIKYVEVEDPSQIVFTLNRGQVREIKFSYGKVIKEQEEALSDSYFFDDHRSNIKLNFFALGTGVTALTYERSLNLYSSWEASVKVLGLGINADDNNIGDGVALDMGYKIKLKSITKGNRYRPNHLLDGGYLRFRGGYGYAKRNYSWSNEERTVSALHAGFDIGKQWVLQNRIALDLFGGFHYFGGSFTRTNGVIDTPSYEEIYFGDLGGSDNVAISFGLRIGVMFEKLGGGSTGGSKSRR